MRHNRFNRRTRSRLIAEINVVPYIDVTLVLLIIFMVTAPIVQQAVTVDLPNTPAVQNSSSAATPAKPFIITVTPEGLYKSSENPNVLISDKELATLVANVIARAQMNAQQSFYIQGDIAAPYGKVVQIFTLLKANGIEKVSLLTEPEQEGGA